MGNPWSGKLAKSVCSKKRTRTFWNVYFGVFLAVIFICMSGFSYQAASDYIKYEKEEIFVVYEDGYVITDLDSYKVVKEEKQDVDARKLVRDVASGEKVHLTVSKLSGQLLEVKHLGKTVYKKELTPIAPTVIMTFLLVIPMISLCIFMLVVVNAKNPGKRIEKIQDRMVLKFYEV